MNDRLDLSPLGMSDPEWRTLYESTVARLDSSLALRRRRTDPVTIVWGWRYPILFAAGLLLAVLVPVELALERRERNRERFATLVQMSGDAARGVRHLSGNELLNLVGRGNTR